MVKKTAKKVSKAAEAKTEQAARRKLIEELFYDFHSSRKQVYKINFVRGLLFGLGSVLGGTVLVAIVVWILSLFVDWPGIGDFLERFLNTLESTTPDVT